jgi:iron complex outermembrane recepter protein
MGKGDPRKRQSWVWVKVLLKLKTSAIVGPILLMACHVVSGQAKQPDDLTKVNIEDLMNIEVTSVAKKAQKLSETASAVFVITRSDINHSGVTNIPDLLRMVPGLDVAQINSSTWAISSRGFNHQKANKLLVLVDGRAVYTSIYSGVFWDTLDVPLEIIERIEVIRGPGASVWGANAVNGVINVITKNASATQGALVSGGSGTTEPAFGTAMYGGKIKLGNYRIFTKYQDYGHLPDPNGQNGLDKWHLLHGGFRIDQTLTRRDTLTTEGDIYTGKEGSIIGHIVSIDPPDFENAFRNSPVSGGDILARWKHLLGNGSETTLQFYVHNYTRSGPEVREVSHTIDFDFQHHWAIHGRHDLLWGGGYRRTSDDTEGTIDLSFIPADRVLNLYSFFVQDQIALKPNRLLLVVGTKLEDNDLGGFNVQPSARLAWTPTEKQSLWTAVASAEGTPSRRTNDCFIPLTVFAGPDGEPTVPTLFGNPHVKSENVVAYEAGWRTEQSSRLTVDLSAFFNSYRHLYNQEPGTPFLSATPAPLHLVLPMTWENKMHGTTQGIELSANLRVAERWTLSPAYSLLQMRLRMDPDSQDTSTLPNIEGSSPRYQAQLRSRVDLAHGLSWDANAYFVSPLPAQAVTSYTRVDTQLNWHPAERVVISLVGQNLLKDHQLESNDVYTTVNPSKAKRSAHFQIGWQF